MINFGSQDNAKAITALCFIPPDNSCGNLSIIEGSKPTISNNSNIFFVFSGMKFWWLILPAGLSVTFLTGGFYLVGRGLDEVFNPRLRDR